MNADSQEYYRSYEDRYRRVYAQGVEYWSGDPNEIAAVIGLVEEFLQFAGTTPSSGPIAEFGCGEGLLGEHLLRKGYSYTGVDIAPSALEKARKRLAGHESSFMFGDVTKLPELQAGAFVATLDNHCLHMLVTDAHREKYLAEVYRVLKPGGYAWFHEIGQTELFGEPIRTFDDFLAAHPVDLGRCEDREAYTQAGKKVIQLPRLPARFTNCEGYRQEIERAGFDVQLVEARKSGVVVHARKPDGGTRWRSNASGVLEMIETKDAEVLLDFCDRDHVRYRHIIHALASPCPEWDDAMGRSDYVDGTGFVAMARPAAEPENVHFYVDYTNPVGLLVWAQGRRITVEGRVCRYDDFAAWCREFAPASVQTTDPTIAACLDRTLDLDGWTDCGAEYAVDAATFVHRTTGTVRQLTPEDRPLWQQFVQEYAHEPMVNSRPGSQAAVRDFEFMCMGLPVRYYVALDDGRIAGFLTVNAFTSQADEIAAVFVPPGKRRRGYGASLLSAAVQDILDAGRLPAYHAGGAPDTRPDLFRMLTGLGFHLVAVPRRAAILS